MGWGVLEKKKKEDIDMDKDRRKKPQKSRNTQNNIWTVDEDAGE